MEDAAAFWNKVATGYAKRPVKNMPAYEHTLERTRSHLSKDDRVLELGCGTGTTALLLADAVQHITASDISPGMIDIARGKAVADGVDTVDFIVAGHTSDTLERGSYDAVLAFNLLHLLRDVPEAVEAARALVKPGGLFISKTGCLAEKGLKGLFLRGLVSVMMAVRFAPYVGFLTIAKLEAIITDAGFEIVETGDYPASPPSRFIVARAPKG